MSPLHTAWRDEVAVRLVAADRVSRGIQLEDFMNLNDTPTRGPLTAADLQPWRTDGVNIDAVHKRQSLTAGAPRCAGPCDQGRKLCPCPAACAVAEDADADSEPLTLAQLWVDTPSVIRMVLCVAAVILATALGVHLLHR